ncbi:NAD-dependent epimerase/dehydratase family protein [Streptomyces acidicola]|uniref:NAD-dependent epimerase/dehydratase family protein n=1 Tax=Streptomyces acidicola TaxID=2596892 RepID=UPI0037F841C6
MNVFLTGGTGFIGSAVLRRLVPEGHRVTALVRSEASAVKVTAAGATPVVGDITDSAWLATQLAQADGAIHTASPGDETSAAVEAAVADAVTAAYTGTGKAFVLTSGIWMFGNGAAITEQSPVAPPALVSWREDIEKQVLGIPGARPVIVACGVVYGHGGGMPNVISGAPRTESGALTLVGDGSQHWTTVHVDDLADLYVRALQNGRAGSRYIASDGDNPTVRELGEAAARAAGGDGAVHAESEAETCARFGDQFAEAILLDEQATGDRARTELGWQPTQPSLVHELEHGSYTPPS